MLSRLLRTTPLVRRVAVSRRHVASKASDGLKPASDSFSTPSLPPAKMRALISLYHQADDFITPENLSDAIDNAFLQSPTLGLSSSETSYRELAYELRERRALPRIGEGKPSISERVIADPRHTWSGQESARSGDVRNALYGMLGRGQPGFEVLEEEHERIQRHIQKDREAEKTTAQAA